MKVVVMGAGVIGVTTAWYLAREGAEVTVLDRLHYAAIERAARVRHLRLQDMCRGGFSLCSCTRNVLRYFAERRLIFWRSAKDAG